MSASGLLRPFRRDEKAGFAQGAGDALVEQRLGAVCAANGELPWKPELDSGVDKLRNQSHTQMREQFAQVYLSEAISKNEPGVTDVVVRAGGTGTGTSIDLTVTAVRAERVLTARVAIG